MAQRAKLPPIEALSAPAHRVLVHVLMNGQVRGEDMDTDAINELTAAGLLRRVMVPYHGRDDHWRVEYAITPSGKARVQVR